MTGRSRSETNPDADDESTRSELRREAVFVRLTLLGMVIGLATGWLDGPPLLGWAGYGVAYIFGGWYGLKGAVETLRDQRVDIDLLMIVAAIGALSIGAPFEGAMLLFLFSLSNTLQHYAIGRSRRAIKSLVELLRTHLGYRLSCWSQRPVITKNPQLYRGKMNCQETVKGHWGTDETVNEDVHNRGPIKSPSEESRPDKAAINFWWDEDSLDPPAEW
ncbi:hypothetical protein U4E84_14510 [Halorubrum sp. AD140]|nr:hypothetical protein [Halorubrum sp. AD140]MDZ5812557.1 hypothetical protein [Halorubrum sp. AD140]